MAFNFLPWERRFEVELVDTLKGTEEVFGYEWNIYREIIPLHEKQFADWITPISISFFENKRVLDAGCGIGRNALWVLKAGAKYVCAFDYDARTIDVAGRNLRDFKNCDVIYDSIYDINFNEEFDCAFSIGVIHHLARPKDAVKKLVESIKVGGTLIIWVYAREGNETYLKFLDPFRKYFTSRMPLAFTRCVSKVLTALLKAYLVIPSKKSYLSELKKRSFRHAEAMVFDQLIPKISHYWTKDEVLSLVKGLSVEVSHITHVHGMSWSLVAKKV